MRDITSSARLSPSGGGKKDSIFSTLQTRLVEEGRSRWEAPRDKGFPKSRGVGVRDNGARASYFAEENSRERGSHRRINGAAVSCDAGDFPQVFQGIRETSSDVRVAATRPREYEFARAHPREWSPTWVPCDARPRLYGLSVQDAIPNAVISGKAAAQRRATCDNGDCGGERHAWDETVDYSAPLREHSRVTWATFSLCV